MSIDPKNIPIELRMERIEELLYTVIDQNAQMLQLLRNDPAFERRRGSRIQPDEISLQGASQNASYVHRGIAESSSIANTLLDNSSIITFTEGA